MVRISDWTMPLNTHRRRTRRTQPYLRPGEPGHAQGHVVQDGTRAAELRGEADLTRWQLVKLAGFCLRTIGAIEGGRPTGAATPSALATVLGEPSGLFAPSWTLHGQRRTLEAGPDGRLPLEG